MKNAEIIAKLKAQETTIRSLGVEKLFVFGSVLNDGFTHESDVDLFVDFLPEQKTFLNFTNLYSLIEEKLERKIDLLTRKSINQKIQQHIFATMQQVI